jgi:predicted dehydrogenase
MARYTQWAEMARSMLQKDELGPVSHIVFRVIRPTMARYPVWDSPWMLSRDQAGGGALLNLGAHGFDVCRFITGDEPSVISAVLSNAVHQSEVEDYAHVTLRRVLSECFERLRVGRPPPITAQDCARAVTLIHDAYRLARR